MRNPQHLVPLLYGALASAAVFSNNPTAWIGDNRYEQFENPGRFLTRMFSTWDTSRGLGTMREEFWPLAAGPIALFRLYGASTATAVHLWHVMVLVIAGVGLWVLVRAFDPPGPYTAPAAGLVYMFGAYAASFLIPTNLFLNYALAPWIWLFVVRGLRSQAPVRAAAAFALLIFAAGNTEPAGLVYAALYIVPIAAYLIWIERTATFWRAARWLALAGTLSVLTSAAALYKTGLSAEIFEQNLRETESPSILNVASSWSESWRGLGAWLTYHRDIRGPASPQTLPYLTQPVTVLATFVPPILALLGLAFSRWRARLLFGLLLLLGLVLMVGLHPIDDPSAYGTLLDRLYDGFPRAGVIRNSYKAGMGFAAGVAVLAGAFLDRSLEWANTVDDRQTDRRAPRRLAVVSTAAVVLIAVSQPFWNGTLYNPDWELDEVPAYVDEAAAWLNQQDADGRVLVLPDGFRHGFRWGWVNDDVLDAMVARPHAIDVAIHTSRPIPADLLHHVSTSVGDGSYAPGRLGPILERMGVDLVMLRNDVDWQIWGQPRPAAFEGLRRDPDFRLVASFGSAGQFTTAGSDSTLAADLERQLPPIEVYELTDRSVSLARLAPERPPLLVSGAGGSWPALADEGWLDAFGPVVYTGASDADEITTALEGGSPLVVTDSNRRRLELLTIEPVRSWTLGAGEDLLRDVYELFDTGGAEAVATFGDASRIEAIPETFSANPNPTARPGAAFDGDVASAWEFGDLGAVGQRLRIELAEPTDISGVRITLPQPSARRVARARIRSSDGMAIDARFSRQGYGIEFEPRTVDWVELEVLEVAGVGTSRVAIAEVELVGADLREAVTVPRDVFQRAARDAELRAALADAPTAYVFERARSDDGVPEERVMRRDFETSGVRAFELTGALRLGGSTPDAVITSLSENPVLAAGTSRLLDLPTFAGMRALDGDLDTAWIAPGRPGETLSLAFPDVVLRSVTIRYDASESFARPAELRLTTERGESVGSVTAPQCRPGDFCFGEAEIELPLQRAATLQIEVLELTEADLDGPDRRPIRLMEVEINGQPNEPVEQSLRCSDELLVLDGEPVPIRLATTFDELLDSDRLVPFESCDTIQSEAGRHRLEAVGGALMDRATLVSENWPDAPPIDAEGRVESLQRSQTAFDIRVSAPDGGQLIVTQSHHPGWRATADGIDLGEAEPADTFASWMIPPGTERVRVEFRPQQAFEVALAITAAAVALCLGLVAAVRREQ